MSYCRLAHRSILNLKRHRFLKKYSFSSLVAKPARKYEEGVNVLGYTIKEVGEIPELNLSAVYLEHKATGATHLHLASEDSNNFWGASVIERRVGLKTLAENDTGVPHILEHLSLCGSRKYPCKDPFMNMRNRSLSTFMNAFTGSDYTFYGFSTPNVTDYQNLLLVYLDAVFFPLLDLKDFKQEGWRLEHADIHDKNSPIIFKGVVFNEMKGVYSDPNQCYGMKIQKTLFPSSNYSHDFGGDPFSIPNLTWEELKQFHAKYYHPSNSRFFTYGDLPLELHLELTEEHVLKKFQRISAENEVSDVERWTEPKEMRIYNRFDPMAAIPEKQTMISNTYLLNRITDTYESFALGILSTLLIDGPNAPFYQNLLESGIAPDFSPYVGYEGHLKQSLFSIGVREVAEKDIQMVMDTIKSTFDKVISEGFPEERILSILHSVELGLKHRKSNFGLSCAMGVNCLWNHSGNPVAAFKVNDHVKWFSKQLKDNPRFLQDKIVQYFKNNNHKLTLIMSPKENYEAELQAREQDLLNSRLKQLSDCDKLQIYNDGLELEKHQEKFDLSCLPTLKINDVERRLEKTQLQFTTISGVDVQLCEQPTNEIVYFNAVVDASSVPEEYVMLLPLFSQIIIQMGAGGRNYKELDQEIQLKTSGFRVSTHISEHPALPNEFENGIAFSSYCLGKNVQDMFSLWADIFNRVNLEDHAHLSHVIKLIATELAQGISHMGHLYCMRTASSSLNLCGHVKEELSGLSQIKFMKKLAGMENHKEVLSQLKNLSTYLLQKGKMRCAINAMPGFMPKAVQNLETLLKSLPINSESIVKKKCPLSRNLKTHFILPLSVNFLGQSTLTVPYCNKDYASLKVAAGLISHKYLHKEIREKGGAYGGGATLSKGGNFMFYSYRDPNITKTLESFDASLDWLVHTNHTSQDIDEAKLGVFSQTDAPVTPGAKGTLYFKERISHEMKEEFREHVFQCNRESLISACEKYLRNPTHKGVALIGPENSVTKENSLGWTLLTE